MTDLQWLESIINLPLQAILIGCIVFLWRKIETVQNKYETVLVELGELRGRTDVELRLEQKFDLFLKMSAKN